VYLMSFSVVLEVYQFARDAAVAEAWLIAHEPYLSSQEYGVCYLSSGHLALSLLYANAVVFLHLVHGLLHKYMSCEQGRSTKRCTYTLHRSRNAVMLMACVLSCIISVDFVLLSRLSCLGSKIALHPDAVVSVDCRFDL